MIDIDSSNIVRYGRQNYENDSFWNGDKHIFNQFNAAGADGANDIGK